MAAPKLEPHCGSWVIVQAGTNTPIRETFDQRIADHVAKHMPGRFEVLTAAAWLARLNSLVKAGVL